MPAGCWVAAYNGPLSQVRTQQFDTKLSREVVELKALDGRLFATVLLNDQLHVTALLLDVATGQMQYLPSVYEPLPTQLTFVADAATRRAEYVLSQTNGRKSRLLLKQLTDRGQLVSSEFVQAESERSLITAQVTPAAGHHRPPAHGHLLAARPRLMPRACLPPTCAPRARHPARRCASTISCTSSIFSTTSSPAARPGCGCAPSAAWPARVPPLRWHYRLLLHELLPQPDGGYVLVAEVYYPHYRYNSYGSYAGPFNNGLGNQYGTSPYGNSRVFDGYQTTHALVCGFDRAGNLLWDNIFVVENLRRYELEEAVRVQPLPDGRLVLAYLDEDKLRYKVMNRGRKLAQRPAGAHSNRLRPHGMPPNTPPTPSRPTCCPGSAAASWPPATSTCAWSAATTGTYFS